MPTRDDPFAKVMSDLKSTVSAAALLEKPIDITTTIVQDIDLVLKAVSDLISGFSIVTTLISVFEGAANAIVAIPALGWVAEAINAVLEAIEAALDGVSDVLSALKTDIIDPVDDVLAEVLIGLKRVRDVIDVVAVKLPDYLNTVEVLSYLADVAEPVTDVLKGMEPAERLKALLDELIAVRDAVGTAVEPLSSVLKTVGDGAKTIEDAIEKAVDAIGDQMKQAANAFQAAIDSVLQPISNGVQAAINAIAPVKWALHAIKWLFNKIVKPVIKWITEKTGLQALFDAAGQEIAGAFHVKPVLDLLQTNMDPDATEEGGKSVNAKSGDVAKTAFNDIIGALSNYRTDKGAAVEDAMAAFATAITGTPVDPDAAPELPDWPDLPDFKKETPDKSGRNALLRVAPAHVEASIAWLAAPTEGRAAFSLLLILAAANEDVPLPDLDPAVWPQSTALIGTLTGIASDLSTLNATAEQLSTGLDHFQTSLSLPSTFSTQLVDLAAILTDADGILSTLKKVKSDVLVEVISVIDDVITTQNTAAAKVAAKTPALTQSVNAISAAVAPVITSVPDLATIGAAVRHLDGWGLGVAQLAAMIDAMRAQDPDGTYKAELDAVAATLEDIASGLATRAASIDAHSKSLKVSITGADGQGGLNGALGRYGETLKPFSDHSALVQDKAMPALIKTRDVMDKTVSIFDPLSHLLEMEGCLSENADADGIPEMVYEGGKECARQILVQAKHYLHGKHDHLAQQIRDFADEALPLSKLERDLEAASDALTGEVAGVTSDAGQLATALDALKSELAATKSYEWLNPETGETETVEGDIIDGPFAQQLSDLARKFPDPDGSGEQDQG
ncbi:MAG: hypothetical protein QNJ09_14835 [Paracoccaceae bacterium]|nr:hypothetical protein [Paracoccaceae bacterium]